MYRNRTPRKLSFFDRAIIGIDQGLRTLSGTARGSSRPRPGVARMETSLSDREKRHVAGLMRVDHAGEVAAQALYQGQAATARSPRVREIMEQAALEENDHLNWCRERLDELDAKPSRLDPVWYAGSFAMGAVAGLLGDRVSLSFLAETERQVVKHLESHIDAVPPEDERSRELLLQMREDEAAHATKAVDSGAVDLPKPVKKLMQMTAKIMTRTAYRL